MVNTAASKTKVTTITVRQLKEGFIFKIMTLENTSTKSQRQNEE